MKTTTTFGVIICFILTKRHKGTVVEYAYKRYLLDVGPQCLLGGLFTIFFKCVSF